MSDGFISALPDQLSRDTVEGQERLSASATAPLNHIAGQNGRRRIQPFDLSAVIFVDDVMLPDEAAVFGIQASENHM